MLLRKFATCCAAAAIGLVCATTRAGVVAGDHFNLSPLGTQATDLGAGVYTGGNALGGSGPAVTGFNAGTNWGSGSTTGTMITPSVTGLSYTDGNGLSLDTSGAMLQYTGVSGSTALDRYTRVSNDATARTTYYASALINVSSFAAANTLAVMELRFGPSATGTYVQYGLRDGKAVIFNVTGANLAAGSSATATSTETFAAGTTHLLVLKVVGQAGGNDAVTLFVDPTDLTAESGTSLSVTNGLGLLPDAGVNLGLWGLYLSRALNTNTAAIDEMRVGTSWSDVVSVPEPASALAGLAVLGLPLRRRRRTV